MVRTEESKPTLRQMRIKLITSLILNAIIPPVLYLVLRPFFAEDIAPLAIAGAIPATRTVALWVMRRRLDWIGAFALLGFAVAIAFAALSGGNSLLLKAHDQLLTGTVGLILLISAIIDKPLLMPLVRIFARTDVERLGNSAGQKRITEITALAGFLLLAHAGIHVVLALTLPTATFLVTSRIVTLALLGAGAALLWWTRQQVGGSTADKAKSNQ